MKDIQGYEGLYAVTKDGRIWSYRQKKFMSTPKNKDGYCYVGLKKDSKRHGKYVQRLVAKTYIKTVGGKPYVNHKNGIKDDNRVENLEWCTHAENHQHAKGMGLRASKKGTLNGRHKLTPEQVAAIRIQAREYSYKELSKKYGVSHTTIHNIFRGHSWA